jgi:hypothetical protein
MRDGVANYSDTQHLTEFGAKLLSPLFEDMPESAPSFNLAAASLLVVDYGPLGFAGSSRPILVEQILAEDPQGPEYERSQYQRPGNHTIRHRRDTHVTVAGLQAGHSHPIASPMPAPAR